MTLKIIRLTQRGLDPQISFSQVHQPWTTLSNFIAQHNLTFVILLVIFTFHCSYSQTLDRSLNFIKSKDAELAVPGSEMIISNEGLNVFFAKQVSTYLSGTTDLSLYKAYFVLDQPEKRILIGYNFSRNPATSLKRTRSLLTVGVNSAYADDFSNLYSGQALSNDMGISARFTKLGKGVVSFDNTKQWTKNLLFRVKPTAPNYDHKTRIDFQRKNLMNEMTNKKIQEAAEFEKSIASITDPTYLRELRDSFYENANEELVSSYLNMESDLLEKPKSHHWFWTWWVTADFYLPITETKYGVAESISSKIDTAGLKNSKASIILNMLADNKWCRLLMSASYGWRNNNGITTDEFKKYSLTEYKKIGGTDTLQLAQLKNQDVYVGQYETFISSFIRGQVVFFPKFKNKTFVGISVAAEKYSGKYDPFNLRVGLPFSIKGKEDGKPVTFEIQGKWDDFNGDINPGSPKSKFIIGASLGLTLTSKVY